MYTHTMVGWGVVGVVAVGSPRVATHGLLLGLVTGLDGDGAPRGGLNVVVVTQPCASSAIVRARRPAAAHVRFWKNL